jgi:predicted aspartyl protease
MKTGRMALSGKAIFLVLPALLAMALATRADTAMADLPYRIGGDGRVSTDVVIDGQGPFSFLLDTASSRTMLFEHLRQRLGLTASEAGTLKVYAMNNIGTAMPVKPRELRLANQPVTGLILGVLPDDVRPPEGVKGADGILGMDALSNYFLMMDHDALRLKLMDPANPDTDIYRRWPSAELTPYRAKDIDVTLWWLRAKFGDQNVTALLDMGSGITMINWIAAERLGLRKASFDKAPISQNLRDALGTLEPVVTVKGLTIGIADRTFAAQTVIVANAAVFRYFGLDNKAAAIIGPALLRYNSLAIDFNRRRIYIGPTSRTAAAAEAPS